MEEEFNRAHRGERLASPHDTAEYSTVDRALAESGIGLIEVDGTGTIVTTTPVVTSALGYESDALVGRPVSALFSEETVESALSRLAHIAAVDVTVAVPHRHHDGHVLPLSVSASRLDDESEVEYTVVVHAPTGDDKMPTGDDKMPTGDGRTATTAEAEASTPSTDTNDDSEQPTWYRDVFTRSPDAVLLVDTGRDTIRDVNPRACELFGYDCAALVGRSPDDLVVATGEPTFFERTREAESSWTDELDCVTNDGRRFRAELAGSVVTVDDQPVVLTFVKDISEREHYARESQRHLRAMDAALDGMALLDANYTVTYANRAFASLHGSGLDDVVGSNWQAHYTEEEWRRLAWQVVPVVERDGGWRGEATGQRTDGATFPQELSLSELDDGSLVCVVRDISDRKDQLQRFRDLNEVTRELMEAESEAAVLALGSRAITEIIGLPLHAIRRYDADSETLVLAEAPDTVADALGPRPVYDVATTPAGRAFQTDETVITVVDEGDQYGRYPLSESIYVPLGDHGVVSIGTTAPSGFERAQIDLAELLAANVTVALRQATRERTLREMQTSLAAQRDELLTQRDKQSMLLGVSELVSDIADATLRATNRADIERTVCEQLANSELYHFAWIGQYSPGRGRIVPRAAAGVDEGLLDEIAQIQPTDAEQRALDVAIESSEVQVVRGIEGDVRLHEPVRRAAFERGFEEAIAVPLTYEGRNYGGLVVIASHPDAFGEFETELFAMLGELVGYAIRATTDRELLFSDSLVEVEFESYDQHAALVAVTADLDCTLSLAGIVADGDDGTRYYYLLEDAPAAAVIERVSEDPGVERVEVISERNGESLLAFDFSGGSLVHALVSYGIRVREQHVSDGTTRIVAEAPTHEDIRDVVDLLVDRFPETEVVAIHERSQPVKTVNECRHLLLSSLTDRQQASLQTAYVEGYFDWPRRSTAEEVADRLDIASSTFHQHVRIGLQKLLVSLFEKP
ncbi:PAS domain S-box protein [Haloarchaeobius sp. DFWS5]|uniref:PAS domain S-box protein n=1 Tax=Haloarchaeobius sp. DFWS5 TaxID=3446114 RepID=UPI003EB8F089